MSMRPFLREKGLELGFLCGTGMVFSCSLAVRRDWRQWRLEIVEREAIGFALEVVEMKGFLVVEIESDCLKAISKLKDDVDSLTEEGGLSAELRATAHLLGGDATLIFTTAVGGYCNLADG
ncbi:unnamed protein product [Linum trigynum]|uniref:RNase H type-1 domain-containing protein n=1 Tax=Linum trigynum TaxID=586398 RepID=A0AAV2D4R2_9ROSI